MAKALVRAECMKPIFQKAYDLLAMCILFERDTQAALGRGSSTRIINLTSYVIKHYQDPQCLTEAMSFFGTLSKAELALLLNSLRTRGIKVIYYLFRILPIVDLADSYLSVCRPFPRHYVNVHQLEHAVLNCNGGWLDMRAL